MSNTLDEILINLDEYKLNRGGVDFSVAEHYAMYPELKSAKLAIEALITLHTQKAERLAQNKMQVDSALHVEEYHYHRLNDVKIGNASVEELITDSKRRIAHLTNPTEEGEL